MRAGEGRKTRFKPGDRITNPAIAPRMRIVTRVTSEGAWLRPAAKDGHAYGLERFIEWGAIERFWDDTPGRCAARR